MQVQVYGRVSELDVEIKEPNRPRRTLGQKDCGVDCKRRRPHASLGVRKQDDAPPASGTGRGRAAQQRNYLGLQDRELERLRQIVVGTDGVPRERILHLAHLGEHQDGHARGLMAPAQPGSRARSRSAPACERR